MKTFTASLQNELKKVTTRKKFLVFFIIEIIICLLSSFISLAVSKASSGMIPMSLVFSNMPMGMLSFFIQIYIPIIIFMATCDLFAGEVHDGTIRATFMRPVSRFKQFFSKILAILILAAVYLGGLLIITTIIKTFTAHSVSGLGGDFLAYSLDLLPLIVLILFAAMLNQFTSSPSLSIVICVIAYLAFSITGILIPVMSGLLFTGYLQWHNLWIGITIPFMAMVTKMGVLVGYGMIFGCIGYYLFERREV
ncbi:ABC transporter permease [Sinanaerobacter sp. ZZT-01]|uniref:ABC transporter permease n=1 Tax=Sinanaerobacter sp. ZZT-01 TaxID=3111540 RepID=UPI002D79B240|nr:ABC transporter permease [Sinanaerobacter sp. ZZT-01]WRR92567.1 ABC transporter permease [Sinanaerobacter sp. ZZT-01]